jgi:hypothetical protein
VTADKVGPEVTAGCVVVVVVVVVVAAAVVVVAAAVVVVAAAVVVVAAAVVVVAAAVVVVAPAAVVVVAPAAVVVVAPAAVVVVAPAAVVVVAPAAVVVVAPAAVVVVAPAVVVVVVAPVGSVTGIICLFIVMVPSVLTVTVTRIVADVLLPKTAKVVTELFDPSAAIPLVRRVTVQGSILNLNVNELKGWGALKLVFVTVKVHEPKAVLPSAEPSALEMTKFGWVESAALAVKLTVVGTAGKETAAPLASTPEKPVAKVSGVAAVPPEVTATSAPAVCVFCATVTLLAPRLTSAVASSGASLPPKQAARTATMPTLQATRAGRLAMFTNLPKIFIKNSH